MENTTYYADNAEMETISYRPRGSSGRYRWEEDPATTAEITRVILRDGERILAFLEDFHGSVMRYLLEENSKRFSAITPQQAEVVKKLLVAIDECSMKVTEAFNMKEEE